MHLAFIEYRAAGARFCELPITSGNNNTALSKAFLPTIEVFFMRFLLKGSSHLIVSSSIKRLLRSKSALY